MTSAMRPRVLRLLFASGYALLGLIGLSGLVWPSDRSTADWYVGVFFGSLLLPIGVGGLVLLLFISLFDRVRPGPVVDTAPSGAAAMFFRRSSFMVVLNVLIPLGLAVWLGALGYVLHTNGHDVWAAVVALCALYLLWPVAVACLGRVRPGGLWLTPLGLEYRRDAAGWTLAWSELDGVEPRPEEWTVIGVLPRTGGRPVPVEPVVLRLGLGVRVAVQRTVRFMWNYECRMPDDLVCVDCFDLAGGSVLIARTIERCLTDPRFREQLGSEWSLPRRPT
jgi:hypothetical protein